MGKGNDPNCTAGVPFVGPADDDLSAVRANAAANAQRVAQLGQWPSYIDPQESLTGRIPRIGERGAPGFDAGLACALDLIPRERQRLSAQLHAAYTPQAVEQVRREVQRMDPDSDSCWWLAACSVCAEGKVDAGTFSAQLEQFAALADDPVKRRAAALGELSAMQTRYEVRDGVAFATADGGMQAAYLQGHQLAAMYADDANLYFIGTYHPSLGLEEFPWSNDTDEQGRSRSGGVHGSRQFVKCSTSEEYQRAVSIARAHLRVASS